MTNESIEIVAECIQQLETKWLKLTPEFVKADGKIIALIDVKHVGGADRLKNYGKVLDGLDACLPADNWEFHLFVHVGDILEKTVGDELFQFVVERNSIRLRAKPGHKNQASVAFDYQGRQQLASGRAYRIPARPTAEEFEAMLRPGSDPKDFLQLQQVYGANRIILALAPSDEEG